MNIDIHVLLNEHYASGCFGGTMGQLQHCVPTVCLILGDSECYRYLEWPQQKEFRCVEGK
jgi:hypothetical protein